MLLPCRDKASQHNDRAPPSSRAEAKRFMSGRADKVHTTGPSQLRMQPVKAETSFSRKDFLAAQKEAQQLGTPRQCLHFYIPSKGSCRGFFMSKLLC